jgi:hypothetical protein
MVGHQAVGPDFHAGLVRLLAQQVAVVLLIAILEEDGLTPIAACGHMVRTSRDDDAREPSQSEGLAGLQQKRNIAPVPEFPRKNAFSNPCYTLFPRHFDKYSQK